MKSLLLFMLTFVMVFASGCAEPFVGGFSAGAVAMKVMADDSQARFVESVNELNERKAEIDAVIAQVEDSEVKELLQGLVDEETRAALNELGAADWSDSKVVGGYSIAGVMALIAAYQKKKRIDRG